jgi:hypothetical protein
MAAYRRWLVPVYQPQRVQEPSENSLVEMHAH